MNDPHMNDKKMDAVLRTWMQEAPVEQPDRSRVVGNVVGQLDSTRRPRRRWWIFSAFHRKAATKESPSTHHQPTSIPTTNGHNPTVTGRTHSMLSPVKAVTAGALVFALGGVLLIAQPFEQQGGSVPGAATDVEMETPVEFTATWGFGPSVRVETADGLDPTRHRDAADSLRIIEPASDPSFVGDVTFAYNYDEYASTGALAVGSWAFSVENDEGTWRGVPHFSLFLPAGGKTSTAQVFDGERGYEGLYAVAQLTMTPGQGVDVHGFIFEGEPPPAAEPFVSE